MKIKKIEQSIITNDDISLYKKAISTLNGFMFSAADVNIDKRIITASLK